MGARYKSDFLFAQPTLASGAARVLDFAGMLDVYNRSENADSVAIAADWFVVGEDLRKILEQAADDLFATV